MKRGRGGFTLVELLMLIVIISVAAVGLLIAVRNVMPRGARATTLTQAALVAQARMEHILAQKDVDAYENMADPCSGGSPPAALCANPLGFNVTATVATQPPNVWTCPNTALCKVVTVTVSDSTNTTTLITLRGGLAGY
jgi:type II secretory pathway pseudopilin PulG